MLKLNSLKSFFAVIIAAITLSACGYTQPGMNTMFANQQGFCPAGMSYQNGMCVGSNGSQQPGSFCQAGTAYPMYYQNQCNQGFVPMNGMCVCQSTNNNQQSQSNNANSGGHDCRSGYSWAAGGCYQQGICQSGYVYATPYGMCYPIGY